MLHGDRRRLEMAYSLMISLPGTPVIRYGDEIGMGDDLSLPERNACRTPMQWSNEPQGGFTSNPHPKNPVITGGTYGYEHINVADQRRDPNSFMNWMERMIRTRKETPEIGWGDFIIIPTRHRDVLILRYTWHDNSVVVIHNFSPDPIELRFRSSANPRASRAGKSSARKSQITGATTRHLPHQHHLQRPQQGRLHRPPPHPARTLRLPLVPSRRPERHPPPLHNLIWANSKRPRPFSSTIVVSHNS